jgi:hypothetical protein
MLRREVGKSKVSAQSVELFVACLKARGVSCEGFRRGVNLVGDEAKCFRRDRAPRLTAVTLTRDCLRKRN